MDFVILGSTRLTVAGREVPLGAAKQRGFLALLLYHAGSPVRVETAIEHLWAGGVADTHRPNIYALASRIRAALRAAGLPDALVRMPSTGAYRLNVEHRMIDFHRSAMLLERGRDTARSGDYEQSIRILADAIELWQDEPVADLRCPPAEHIRRHMTETLLAAHKLQADNLLRLGRHEAVLALLEPLMQTHDIDEALATSWISALRAADREYDARDYSIEFRRRFRREMRIEPTVKVVQPEQRVLSSKRSAVHTPHQLPADIIDFCGRVDLLGELNAHINTKHDGASVVILDGMPGVGKTTLATHWAHQQSDRFPDGQLYLNASAYGPAPAMAPEEALGRLLHALGVSSDRMPNTIEQRHELFNEAARDRRLLILLDNVQSPEQVRPLIPTWAGCITVVTSRRRLRSLTIREGARTVTVPSLSQEDCLQMFAGILGERRTLGAGAAMSELVHLSGGLPLAVRLIAGHIVERPRATVAGLAQHLRTDLLDSDSDEDDALSAAFHWSYRALDPEAARLFRLLGAYAGPSIGPAAASALLGAAERHTERLLDRLSVVHLIEHDTIRRYRLHDIARLYAANRARDEESQDASRAALLRLLDWYLLAAADAARTLDPDTKSVPDIPPDPMVSSRFGTPIEAMAWCESERTSVVAMVRLASDQGFHRQAWQICGTSHEMLDRYGPQDDMVEINQIALASAEADDHHSGRMIICNNLGAAHYAKHNYDAAAEHFRAALAFARTAHFEEVEMASANNLAGSYLKAGRVELAIEIYADVLQACRTTGNRRGQAAILSGLGEAWRRLGRYDQAAAHYFDALSICQQIGHLRGQATVHSRLAALRLDEQQPRDGLKHCVLALSIHDRIKYEPGRCDTLSIAADAQRLLAQYSDAAHSIRDAIRISAEIDDSYRQSHAHAVLADIVLGQGDVQKATECCRAALKLIQGAIGPDVELIRSRLDRTAEAIRRHVEAAPRHGRSAVA